VIECQALKTIWNSCDHSSLGALLIFCSVDRQSISGRIISTKRPLQKNSILFRSKCHCLLGLDQSDRQDARHVRMLALILPEYLSLLTDLIDSGGLTDRALLKEIKLLRKIIGTNICRRALAELGIDPNSLVPWSKLETCGQETLIAYALARSKS
jgi:hypothetical protein